jgi:CheY-like chemotaxis protein
MRILLVDDQADMRSLLRHWLGEPGWEVLEAASGEEAVAWDGGDWDVMVVDHLMDPGMSGMEVARELRRRGEERPIVVVSAFLPPPLEAEAAEIGVEVAVKEDFPGLIARLEGLAS